MRFIPRENGVHSIDVKFNGCHIPGSPFNVRVGDPGQIGDPGMVAAHGPGLLGGNTGGRERRRAPSGRDPFPGPPRSHSVALSP